MRPNHTNPKKKRHLLGLGLDNQDGHKRITKGDHFHMVGGSEETHHVMVEKSIKLTEQFKKRGKTIANVSEEEFLDTAQSLDMPVYSPKKKEDH